MKAWRLFLAGLALAVLAAGELVLADGWSLLHPFSSGKTETKQPAAPVVKPAPPPATTSPSTLQKIGTGTKNFFSGVGQKVGLTKPAPKPAANPYLSGTSSVTSKANSSGGSSWNPFRKEEAKKPSSMSDFVGLPRPKM